MGIQHSRWDFFFFFLDKGGSRKDVLGWKVRQVDDGWRVRVTLHPCARLGYCMRPTNPTPTQTVARPAGFPQRMVRSAPPTEAMIRRLLLRFKTPASDSQQAGDLARPWPSEPLKGWGQWSFPGAHIDAALGRASLWDTGQPPPSELRERFLSWYTYWNELVLNLSFTVLLPHRDYSRMRDRHTRHSVRVKDL